MRLTIGVKGFLLVAVPLVFELFFVGLLSFLLQQSEAETQRQLRAKTVVAKAHLMMKRAASVTMSAGAYTFTRNPAFSKEYERFLLQIDGDLDDMDRMVLNNPAQRKNIAQMKVILGVLSKRLASYKANLENSDPGDMLAIIGETKGLNASRALISRLGEEMDEFLTAERVVERQSPDTQAANRRNIQIALWGGVAASVLLAISLAQFFSSSISSRVKLMTDNTRKLARGESLNPPMKGDDELTHLDAVFHEVVQHLSEVSQQKQELVAVISHELKTPLTSVSGMLSLMQAGAFGKLNDKGARRVAGAEADLVRVIRLVNDLLDIEKLEAGKLEMHIREVPLANVVARSVISVQGMADVRQITINVSETELLVIGDEDRLVQVLVNLLSNAIKYSPDGTEVQVAVIDAGEFVEVQVLDNGRGVPDDFRDKIFERYTQVEREDGTRKGGTGLGLHVCKRIVEELGGSIGVSSHSGTGSTFWFKIRKLEPAVARIGN